MPRYQLVWEETHTATVAADSADMAREAWAADNLDDEQITDLRVRSYNLSINELQQQETDK